MPHLDALRARLARARTKAAVISGLPELIDTLEAHLVETETRLSTIESDVLPRLRRITELLERLEESV